MIRTIQFTAACVLAFAVAAEQAKAAVVTTELISNGGFETGDFSSWNQFNTGSGQWFINNGSVNWPAAATRSPITGGFDVVSSQDGPSFHDLWQSFTLPLEITTATLSWDDRIFNGAGFSDPNQEFRVLLKSAIGTTLVTIFSTNPGDPNPQVGPNNRSFDLTAFATANAGGTFRLSFEEQDNLNFFNVFVDNVSLSTTAIPEPGIGILSTLGGMATLLFRRRPNRAQG